MDDPTPSQRWTTIDRLLGLALDLAPSERGAFLQEASAGDEALGKEVLKLLEAEEFSPAFLEEGAAAFAAPDLGDFEENSEHSQKLAGRLGPFLIRHQIGAGGMSRVYLAERFEGGFEQKVAIKVMRIGTSNRRECEDRFRAERQILASFDHPEIARVFDGGVTEEGQPYLVMEHVSGLPLSTYCQDGALGLEERLRLMIQTCAAVQYAHQRLVVHRDLKPSNIMVTDQGRVKLLDFGIAKLLDGEILGSVTPLPSTRTGFLLLTPEYAAPEQLQGAEVTTATDVYALGVLLYELLSGQRPYQLAGQPASQVERIVCHEEPKKPSTAALVTEPSPNPIPYSLHQLEGDLDTVVLKALAKEPHNRYGSARELADDLGRFLRGETVEARPVGRLERWFRQVRRHRRISVAAALVAGSLLILGSITVHTRWTAEREALAAQHFGQEVEQIEAVLQRAYLTPLHDIRPELAQVRERMKRIQEEMNRFGGASKAIGEFALGRGFLALGEEEKARIHLQQAWDAGLREVQVEYALGLSLSRLYRAALEDLSQIEVAEVRALRRQEIEIGLRDPAIRAMKAARRGSFHGEYVEASLAFFAGDPQKALVELAGSARTEPWFYEADLLAGDIHFETYRSAADTGDAVAALEALNQAQTAFTKAAEVARSDPRSYEGLCRLRAEAMRHQYHGWLQDLEGLREAAVESCRQAILANRDRPQAHLRLGYVEWLWTDHRAGLGDDPRVAMEVARRHLRRAADLDSDNARAWATLGVTYRTEASFNTSRGEDPTQAFALALESYRQATTIDPRSYSAYRNLGGVELHLGDFEHRRGGDSEPHFESAITAARKAIELQPALVGGHINLGIAYGQLAILHRDRGGEALPFFEAGASALRRAIEINPDFYTAHFNLAELLVRQAEMRLTSKRDPRPLVEEAGILLTKAEEAWPDWAPTYFIQARGQLAKVRWAQIQNENPKELMRRAEQWTARGNALGSDNADGLALAAEVQLAVAEWRLNKGEYPQKELSQAETWIEETLAVNGKLAEAFKHKAKVHWLRGRWLLAQSVDPRTVLEEGIEAAQRGIQENPADAESHLQLARLESLWAEWQLMLGEDPRPRIVAARQAVTRSATLRQGYPEAREFMSRLDELSRLAG